MLCTILCIYVTYYCMLCNILCIYVTYYSMHLCYSFTVFLCTTILYTLLVFYKCSWFFSICSSLCLFLSHSTCSYSICSSFPLYSVSYAFFMVLCFSAFWTTFSSTNNPFLLLILFMYLLAIFSRSANSPNSSSSSSV